MKTPRRNGLYLRTLCSQIVSPQSFWHLKICRVKGLRWKLRKIFWQWELLQRNSLLKENMEVLRPRVVRQSLLYKIFLDLRLKTLFVSSFSAICYLWLLERHRVVCFYFSVLFRVHTQLCSEFSSSSVPRDQTLSAMCKAGAFPAVLQPLRVVCF